MLVKNLALFLTLSVSLQTFANSVYRIETVKGKDNRGSFDVSYIQLEGSAYKNLNAVLKAEALNNICEAVEAPSAQDDEDTFAPNPEDMSTESNSVVTRLDDNYLAVETMLESYCGGAYPESNISHRIFNLKEKVVVDLASEIRKNTEVNNLIVKQMIEQSTKDIPECSEEYTKETFESETLIVGLGTDALKVTPDFPHVIQACAFDTIVKLNDLKGLTMPGTQLDKLVNLAK